MQNEPSPGWRLRLLWMSLAACPSILLLAFTTFLTQDVAAIPFLWILPLAAYLLSFIICFEAPRLYNRTFFLIALVAALAGMARIFATHGEDVRISLMIAITVSSLFVFCMVCHGELVRSKPHTRRLTLFYVMLSIGGALGGVFVGIVAPGLFHAFYEFPIGLGLCAFLAVVVLWDGQRWSSRGVLIAGLFAYAVWLGVIMHQFTSGYRVMERNFYGQIRVRQSEADDDLGPRRTLLHGRIAHGEQVLDEAYSRLPSTYFCPDTGVGRALSNRAAPRRVGILGLGSGTLAVYGRQGDTFRIYEINPQVVEVARTEFTYLRDTSAKVETVLGDGRLMLEREPDQHFDVLVMDAFSGDSVPVHLITLEAFATYLRHMKPDGIVAVNISNKFLNLRPVMERAASRFGKVALAFDFISDGYDTLCYDASWVLIMDEAVHRAKAKQFTGGEVLEPVKGFRPWTDGFSNMFRILK